MSLRGYIAISLLMFLLPWSASATEGVRAFTSHIEINKNGSADVQEEIVFDFGEEQKHGIIREIPLLRQSSGFAHNIEITSISVTDGKNHTREASFDEGSGNIAVLKIGDPDMLVSGTQFYVIRYTLWNTIESRLQDDRFSYDITGSSWRVPIDKIRAEIQLPGEFSFTTLQPECTISSGDSGTPCAATSSIGIASSSAHLLRYEDANVSPNTGMNISLSFPKGIIIYQQKVSDRLDKGTVRHSAIYAWWNRPFLDYSLAIPFLVFGAMLSILFSEREDQRTRAPRVTRSAYLITGLAMIGISFVIPTLNLALLLSGITIFCFSFFFAKKLKSN